MKSSSSGHAHGDDEGQSAQSIYRTLCDLLRIGLVSQVHASHFRSDPDNRSEAEKVVPHPEEYKAKSKRERDAQHEVAIRRKLKAWKYWSDGKDYEVEGSKAGRKRLQQDPELQPLEKRQRLYPPSNQEVLNIKGIANQLILGETGDLDVSKIKSLRSGWVTHSL